MDRNAEIIRKVANGMSRAKAARQFGLTGERVSQIVNPVLGNARDPRKVAPRTYCSPEQRAAAVRLVDQGLSYSKAAKRLGMTRNQVAGAVNRATIALMRRHS